MDFDLCEGYIGPDTEDDVRGVGRAWLSLTANHEQAEKNWAGTSANPAAAESSSTGCPLQPRGVWSEWLQCSLAKRPPLCWSPFLEPWPGTT
jgi:hypothetical protein